MNWWDKFSTWVNNRFSWRLKTTAEIAVWYRLWSIRLGLAGTAVTSALVAVPDWTVTLWNTLPYEVRQFVPPQYMPLIGVGLFVLSMVARFVRQNKAAEKLAEKKAAKIAEYRAEVEKEYGQGTRTL